MMRGLVAFVMTLPLSLAGCIGDDERFESGIPYCNLSSPAHVRVHYDWREHAMEAAVQAAARGWHNVTINDRWVTGDCPEAR